MRRSVGGLRASRLRSCWFQREYTEQTTRTCPEALLQERLSPTELSALLAQGAALSPEDAITLALSRLND
jgi:hypothetical protein